MASPHLASTLAVFEGQVHRTKNRLIAIPADVQRKLRLVRRGATHLVLYSIRVRGQGRWNHHWAQLTQDNEFAVPSDVSQIVGGQRVDVKIHRIVLDQDALVASPRTPGELLVDLGNEAGEDDARTDGSLHVDDYLYGTRTVRG
jgi:hypothetical protein